MDTIRITLEDLKKNDLDLIVQHAGNTGVLPFERCSCGLIR